MLYDRPADLGFSLNPFHYVKVAAKDVYKGGKAVVTNKTFQTAAVTAANAYSPGSGTAVQAGFSVITPSGGTVATPVPSAAPPPPAAPPTSAPDADVAPRHAGGEQLLGMPKKYVVIGGAVLGGLLLLSILRR